MWKFSLLRMRLLSWASLIWFNSLGSMKLAFSDCKKYGWGVGRGYPHRTLAYGNVTKSLKNAVT